MLADSKDVSNFFLGVPCPTVASVEEHQKLLVIGVLDRTDNVDEVTVPVASDVFGDAVPEVGRSKLWFVHHVAFFSRSRIAS